MKDLILSLIDHEVQTVIALNKEDLVKDKTTLLKEISRINKKSWRIAANNYQK